MVIFLLVNSNRPNEQQPVDKVYLCPLATAT